MFMHSVSLESNENHGSILSCKMQLPFPYKIKFLEAENLPRNSELWRNSNGNEQQGHYNVWLLGFRHCFIISTFVLYSLCLRVRGWPNNGSTKLRNAKLYRKIKTDNIEYDQVSNETDITKCHETCLGFRVGIAKEGVVD